MQDINLNGLQGYDPEMLLSFREEKRRPSVGQVCGLFSISVILLLFIASRVQRNSFYSGILITEYVLILLPPLIFLVLWKYDIKDALGLNRVSILNLFLTFCIMLFSIPVVNVLNALYYLLLKLIFGRVVVSSIPPATDAVSLLVNVFVVGISAGICEEVLFRGVIQRGLGKLGGFLSILITSVLFGLWHNYLPSFFGTALLGGVIGFIAYRTNSFYSAMFAHFTNNFIAVVMGYLSVKIQENLGPSALEGVGSQLDPDVYFGEILSMEGPELMALIGAWVFIVLFCLAILSGLITAFMRTTSETVRKARYKAGSEDIKGLAWLLPGLMFIGFVFYVNALSLKGANLGFVEPILKIIGLR